MSPNLEETIILDFITSSPTTGAAVDADSTPTCEIFEDATDTTVISLTVTKRASKTGNYRVSIACTAANGFESAKSYNVIASATVGGISAKARIGGFQVRTLSLATDISAIKTVTDQFVFTTANQVDARMMSTALTGTDPADLAEEFLEALRAEPGTLNTEPSTWMEKTIWLAQRFLDSTKTPTQFIVRGTDGTTEITTQDYTEGSTSVIEPPA